MWIYGLPAEQVPLVSLKPVKHPHTGLPLMY